MPSPTRSRVVALVAARDMADSVGPTVASLRSLEAVEDVVVVDDGSSDATGQTALEAGARVLRLGRNVGKGGAVRAGVEATPEADVYLLVDADVGASAHHGERLVGPVLGDEADVAVGVLPGAGRRGGLGLVRRLSAWGARRATGAELRAPLSGQRAVRADLLRSGPLAERFGLETAVNIDARRAGARVVEVEVPMEHRHRGRSLAGFGHRAGQGVDIARALWPRLTTSTQRIAAIVLTFCLLITAALWAGSRSEPSSVPLGARPTKAVVIGVPRLSWDDVGTGRMPNLDRLVRSGAAGAATVRTLGTHPSTAEGYATLGAGSRVRADPRAGEAVDGPGGEVVVTGAPATMRLNRGRQLPSRPGALGDALARAGLRTAAVGNADGAGSADGGEQFRPAAVALARSDGRLDGGRVGTALVTSDPAAPVGRRADRGAVLREVRSALSEADVVVVDPGDMDRAAKAAPSLPPEAAATARRQALGATDGLVGEVADLTGDDALLLVVSVAPPGEDWHLTPVVASGPGVPPGHLHSPSTRRPGLVTLTDVAPTILAALGAPVPEGMIGHALRYRPGEQGMDGLRDLDRDASFREDYYFRLTITYIVLQALVYLLAALAFSRLGGVRRAGPWLRLVVLAFSAWPLATFLLRAIPDVAALGGAGVAVLVALDAAIVAIALRFRGRPLAPLAWICGATVAVLVGDVATGANLQLSSFLGYSPYTAARFVGLGNAAFAALASTTILAAALHVHHAPRRPEALVTAAGVFALVIVADGAPSLGSDVGGILTLVPVFGLTLVALIGRRLSWRILTMAAGVTAVAMAVAIGVDLLRPPDARTHLGQLVSRVLDQGWEPLTTVLSRKAAGNLRTYGSPWTWAVPVITVYGLYVLARAPGRSTLLPAHSPLRTGAVALLAAGLLGCAVNDSGVVVTALIFVYIGPFLTLVALESERGGPTMVDPASITRAVSDSPAGALATRP